MLTKLCHCAYVSLLEFLRTTIGLADGVPGVVMTIHTFGDYPEKFHPHLHAMVSDGLFRKSGTFYVMPKVDLKPLEKIFQANVFIAAICQHIPEKSFQMVRYYGWYSNKQRGIRRKEGLQRPGDEPELKKEDIEIIDVADYQPPQVPSKTWRECIKKIWQHNLCAVRVAPGQ